MNLWGKYEKEVPKNGSKDFLRALRAELLILRDDGRTMAEHADALYRLEVLVAEPHR